jgi:hypothetical protein
MGFLAYIKEQNKIKPKPNSDGLIKCLRQPGLLQSQPLKSMREKFVSFIEFCAPRQFRLPGQSLRRAAGRRAGALFFALHRDYFVVTRNFTAVNLDLLPSNSFTVTRSSQPFTGTGKKQGTATLTAPNQTAGPLGAISQTH